MYGKRVTCRVHGGSVRIICPQCKKRIIFSVRTNEKNRTITCHHCKRKIPCVLNRRHTVREAQAGKARLDLMTDKHIVISLRDISCNGVGFSVSLGQAKKFFVGKEISSIMCDWNPRFPHYKLIVRNISGGNIGASFIK